MTLLAVEGVSKSYPGVQALYRVSLAVTAGEVLAIIGPNGAGKSTLFGVISGEQRPDEGQVVFAERPITGIGLHRAARAGISRAFQVPHIYLGLTVAENLLTACIAAERTAGRRLRPGAFLHPARRFADRVAALTEEIGLLGREAQRAGTLSHGDKKRLELAMALAIEPRLLLLDEPTAGMSPEETRAMVALIKQLHLGRGLTVVLTEHDMTVVFSLAERLVVLNRGEVIAAGRPDAVRADPKVVEVYLGKSEVTADA